MDDLTYYSAKNHNTFCVRSPNVLKRMMELEADPFVTSYDLSIVFVTTYKDARGCTCECEPDLYVRGHDGIVLERVIDVPSDDDVLIMAAINNAVQQHGFKHRVIQYDMSLPLPSPQLKKYHNDYGCFYRPTEESIFTHMVTMVANRATCLRKKVGAVITDVRMQRVLCFGYNGNVAHGPNQCDSLGEGVCGCTHAEINALTKSVTDLEGALCFLTLSPCLACAKVLVNRGISRVIYGEAYRNSAGVDLLRAHGVVATRWHDT